MNVQPWGSDVRVSMPLPTVNDGPSVPMFGFIFTVNGLSHDLSESDYERLATPTYAPLSPADTVWDDADLEGA